MNKRQYINNRDRESGFALLIALTFLLVLTTVGITLMNSSTLEYRMGANAAFHEQAFQAGEGGRKAITNLLPDHVYARGWTGIPLPTGVTVKDKDEDGTKDNFFIVGADASSTTENLQIPATLVEDATYQQGTIQASIAVISAGLQTRAGSGQEMFRGYDGLGQGTAAGGGSRIFEVRSTGTGPGNASATVASYYQVIIN